MDTLFFTRLLHYVLHIVVAFDCRFGKQFYKRCPVWEVWFWGNPGGIAWGAVACGGGRSGAGGNRRWRNWGAGGLGFWVGYGRRGESERRRGLSWFSCSFYHHTFSSQFGGFFSIFLLDFCLRGFSPLKLFFSIFGFSFFLSQFGFLIVGYKHPNTHTGYLNLHMINILQCDQVVFVVHILIYCTCSRSIFSIFNFSSRRIFEFVHD